MCRSCLGTCLVSSHCGTPLWFIVNSTRGIRLDHLVLVPKNYIINDGGGRDVLMQSYFCCTCMCMYMLWPYLHTFVSFLVYPCISGGTSTMVKFWHGTIHFPEIHWLGRARGRRSACRPSAVGAANVNYWQSKRRGWWVVCRHGAGPSEPVYLS